MVNLEEVMNIKLRLDVFLAVEGDERGFELVVAHEVQGVLAKLSLSSCCRQRSKRLKHRFPTTLNWLDPTSGYVVASSDEKFLKNHLCLMASNKQQI